MLTVTGCLWLAGQESHMVVSYGQLTRKGESQRVNPVASLLRIMSQHRTLSISRMKQLEPAWGLNNLDKNVNTCLFRKWLICSVSSLRHRQVWKGSCPGCARFSNFCTNTSIAAPAAPAPSVWSWLAPKRRIIQLWFSANTWGLTGRKQGHTNLQTWMLLQLFKIVLGQASWLFFLHFKYKLPLCALRLWPQLCFLLFSFFLMFFHFLKYCKLGHSLNTFDLDFNCLVI